MLLWQLRLRGKPALVRQHTEDGERVTEPRRPCLLGEVGRKGIFKEPEHDKYPDLDAAAYVIYVTAQRCVFLKSASLFS